MSNVAYWGLIHSVKLGCTKSNEPDETQQLGPSLIIESWVKKMRLVPVSDQEVINIGSLKWPFSQRRATYLKVTTTDTDDNVAMRVWLEAMQTTFSVQGPGDVLPIMRKHVCRGGSIIFFTNAIKDLLKEDDDGCKLAGGGGGGLTV